jgi:Multiubiquitin
VVILAFGPPNYDSSAYTITYRHGTDKGSTLVQGQSVQVKSGMIFNVVRTDKS